LKNITIKENSIVQSSIKPFYNTAGKLALDFLAEVTPACKWL
jgi:hypothetical protein